MNHKSVGWIRPVSERNHGELLDNEWHYIDGTEPVVLDVMDVAMTGPCPDLYQQENWLIDPTRRWTRVGRLPWKHVPQLELVDPTSPLWANDGADGDSTYHGLHDRIPLSLAASLTSSLRLVRVSACRLVVFTPGAAFLDPKRRVQARFEHAGQHYRFWVTDPIWERQYLGKPDGEYQLAKAFLTISLSEPYQGYCHKLVAAILELPDGI